MMRRCPRSEELREALAAEEPLSATLAAHVAACGECARVWAAARRFDSRLDTAMAELITDALPPSTVTVARTAPLSARRGPSPGIILSALATTAVVTFAVVGVVTTGASISDAVRDGFTVGANPSERDLDTVNCYLGEPAVEVVAETIGDAAPAAVVAYCFGPVERLAPDLERAVTCVRSFDPDTATRPGAEGRLQGPSSEEAPEVHDYSRAYLGACTRVEDVDTVDDAPDAGTILPMRSAPFRTWDQAAVAVAWPVLRPGWLPDGYQFEALQGFAPPTEPEAIDSVLATYLRNGTPLSIDQFVIADPDAFRIELTIPGDDLGEVSTGRTTVDEHPAFWAAGVVQTAGGPGLDLDSLVLTWSDGRVGYRITSRNEDLDALRRIAESLVEG